MKEQLIIVGSTAHSLINFRYDLILESSKKYEVTAISKDYDLSVKKKLNKIKVNYFNFGYKKKSIYNELTSFLNLRKIFKKSLNGKIISYTLRSNIFCGIISLFTKNVIHYPMITGLGNIYLTRNDSTLSYLNYIILLIFLKISLINSKKIIFQNYSDKFFFDNSVIKKKSLVISGSGVNTKKFKILSYPKKITFLMISRIIKNKGIETFLKASKDLKKKYKNINFIFAGKKNDYFSLDYESIFKLKKDSGVIFLDWKKDVKKILSKSSVFVLLSKREGMSRSILEAMSCGRSIITTNVPGCKETVKNNFNGYKITYNDINELKQSIKKYIDNPNLISRLGKNSRKLAIKKFDVQIVNSKILKFIK